MRLTVQIGEYDSDGASDSGSVIRRECPAEADMGVHGKAYTIMVSYPNMNVEPAKDPTYGKIAGNHSGYQRSERTSRFQSDRDC